MRSVTLDSNVYVSALEFGGKPMELLQAGLDREIEIAISHPIIDESLRVLRDKFGWAEVDLHEAKTAIRASTREVHPTETVDVVTADRLTTESWNVR